MRNFLFYFYLISSFSFSQTILNSESILNSTNEKVTAKTNVSINLESGNENTFATFNQILVGTKINNRLWRILVGHDYENDEGVVVANDWSGQLRVNQFINSKNSFYAFSQIQNIRILKMKHRFLIGAGYRQSVFKKENQYLDLALGVFYENEKYPGIENSLLRYNLNCFGRLNFSEKLFFTFVTYFQASTKDSQNIKLFFEPKINFEFEKLTLSLMIQNRFNSSPYIQNKRNDLLSQLVLSFPLF